MFFIFCHNLHIFFIVKGNCVMQSNTNSDYFKIIADCDFNNRAKNALKGSEIVYLVQLLSYSEQDLLEMRLVGKDTVENIKDVLTKMGGYKLGSINLTEELKKTTNDFSLARMRVYLETYYPLNLERSSLRNEGYSLSLSLNLNAHFQLAVQQNPDLLSKIARQVQEKYGDEIREISDKVLRDAVLEQVGIIPANE
jgi:hypothetical protein